MRLYQECYAAKRTPSIVTVPPIPVLAVDGEGDPDGPAYKEAVSALFGVSYAARFALKRAGILDYSVMPLEGLWWSGDDSVKDITTVDRATWRWTMLIAQPAEATATVVDDAVAATRRKRPSPALDRLQRRTAEAGEAAQILHIGPYAAERPTIETLLRFIDDSGHTAIGRHHEIYLSDPSRAAPEKLRTILRYRISRPR